MHGRGGDEKKLRRWHMSLVSSRSTASVPLPPVPLISSLPPNSLLPESGSFLKDGRKIRVGDCALFQAGNAPPFIGIICWLKTSEAHNTELCVNWLYRPTDVKLAKGILPDASPNEVFYSFHKDVISAASLLHPCKVAFLRKGIDLPAGISSFVCRRVYDTENKCLWWLTDQDYIDERQAEVDQLLDRTRLEMHAALQSGGRSSKQLNSPSSATQLKYGSDGVQNNGSSFTSQAKGKKRDRSDSCTEPIKRERDHPADVEDGDSVSFKSDNMKAEIAKMTEKGSLTSAESVEKLVNFLLLDRVDKKIDLASRVMLADMIATTNKQDCLGKFVMLGGATVLDDWLQEVHKGKPGDGSSIKESDKATEELLLALLRALYRLPVNLNALQTCNIGKSVNHLRSHKNMEIQKKARCLVDIWKKRVDAEMKNNEVKSAGSVQSVAWPGKPCFAEASHAGNRHYGSVEMSTKISATQSHGNKAVPGKPGGHADAVTKSASVASGTLKHQDSLGAPAVSKELVCRQTGGNMIVELPVGMIKEEKSSGSIQSQNNSQSCSSDHAKTIGSLWKEDTRSSTVGPMTVSKALGNSSRHRRCINGLPGATIAVAHKETCSSKPVSANKTLDNKTTQSGLTCERQLDSPIADNGNSHRLIVKLPNPGRSPARSASGSSFEDPSTTGSRASSPSLADKNEQSDRKLKLRSDSLRSHIPVDANAESWQSNYVKDGLASDEGDGSPGVLDDEHSRTADESGKVADPTRNTCLLSGIEKGDVSTEPKVMNSLSSINALIESCAKYSEGGASLPDGYDNGMDLLASVAAGEMSKSEAALSGSPRKEEPCSRNNENKSRSSCDDSAAHNLVKFDGISSLDSRKHEEIDENLGRKDTQFAGPNVSSNNQQYLPLQENSITEPAERSPVSHLNPDNGANSWIKSEGNNKKYVDRGDMKARLEGEGVCHHQDNRGCSEQATESNVDYKPTKRSPSAKGDGYVDVVPGKVGDGSSEVVCNYLGNELDNNSPIETSKEQMVQDAASCTAKKLMNAATTIDDQQNEASVHAVAVDRLTNDAVGSSHSDESQNKISDEFKTRDGAAGANKLESKDGELKDRTDLSSSNIAEGLGLAVASLVTSSGVDGNVGKIDCSMGSTNQEVSCNVQVPETKHSVKPTGSKISSNDGCRKEEPVMLNKTRSEVLGVEDVLAKVEFDLNEGIFGEDGHQCELAPSAAPVCSSSGISFPSLPPLMSRLSSSYSAPITVAAAAKGTFLPLEKLLKIKGEPGWKGSAATSAFRPAEPRRIMEMPPSTCDVPASDAAGKPRRHALDIDLNVPDERVFEEIDTQGSAQMTASKPGIIHHHVFARAAEKLDLDLNRTDEITENGHFSVSSSCRLEASLLPVRSPFEGFAKAEGSSSRDFDLNGPGVDEVNVEATTKSQVVKSTTSLPVFPPAADFRTNNPEIGNASSWFPPGNSYPAVAIPSFLPDGSEQGYPIAVASGAQRAFGSVTGVSTFGSDIYRGPVLSSSPAMAFSPARAFPYTGFPFISSFPLASASFSTGSTSYVDSSSVGAPPGFPAIPSLLVGPTGAVSSHYPRPYFISLPEGSTGIGLENNQVWARQGLDLNSGPGGTGMDGKDEKLPPSSRQILATTSQAFAGEQARVYQAEQVRIYQTSVGGVKRREPEGGWDAERSHKQLSWQ